MKERVSELVIKVGFDEVSFNEIFELRHSEADTIDSLKTNGFFCDEEELREKLEYAGERCALYAGLIESLNKEINQVMKDIECNVGDTYAERKWLGISQTHRDVYDMMGFLTLLQMDAITTVIGLIQAQNDTERKMLSKHAYTIIFEVRENDLFKKVSVGMRNYPAEIVNKDELDGFWKGIKAVFKEMISTKVSKSIRDNLDAHKNKSFVEQIELYKKCDWSTSVVNLFVLIRLIDTIQQYMDNIHDKLNVLFDHYQAFIEKRMKQFEEILGQLRGSRDTFYHKKCETRD